MSEQDEVIHDLVDALREIMAGVDPECGEPDCMECKPWRQARAAIAKATGEPQ